MVRSSTYFVSRSRGHLITKQSQSEMNMCSIAHEKTDSAMIAAYVWLGSDAAPHSPTLRWKLNTRWITRRSPRGKFQSIAAPPTHVPQPHLLKALRHVRQSRCSAHARLVVLPFFQHQVLPRRHFGRSGFACSIIGAKLGLHPLIHNGLEHAFPHAND